jgi:hypothetical protein
LGPGEFIRFAFLTDDDNPLAGSTYIVGVSNQGYGFTPFSWFNATNEEVVDPVAGVVDAYMAIISLRGTLGTIFSGGYKVGTGPTCESSMLLTDAFNQNPTLPTLVPVSAIQETQ